MTNFLTLTYKTTMRKSTILIMFVLMAAMKAIAQNPVVQTWYTSDPAPMVFGDRIYMYTGHDEDKAYRPR